MENSAAATGRIEKPHKRLVAWQRSMELVVVIYDLTKSFPKEETYGLTSQLRRAVFPFLRTSAKERQDVRASSSGIFLPSRSGP